MISVFHSPQSIGVRTLGITQERSTRIPNLTSYTHQILSVGGCWSASLLFAASRGVAEDWFWHGLGRAVDVYSGSGNMVWQGLVNRVLINIGNRAITVGPLLDIGNRVNVSYSFRDFGTGESTAGEYRETGWADSRDSINLYGELHMMVSGGQDVDQHMIELRDTYIAKHKYPKYSENASAFPGNISVQLECIGYTQVLEKHIYNRPYTASLTYTLEEKIRDILADNYNYGAIIPWVPQMTNLGVESYYLEDKNRTAWGIIKDAITKSHKDIVCGMFPGYSFVYRDVERTTDPIERQTLGTFDYRREMGGNRIMIGSRFVEPSEVLPGRYMVISDFNRPIRYPITSVTYTLQGDTIAVNEHIESLGQQFARTMLGPE